MSTYIKDGIDALKFPLNIQIALSQKGTLTILIHPINGRYFPLKKKERKFVFIVLCYSTLFLFYLTLCDCLATGFFSSEREQ